MSFSAISGKNIRNLKDYHLNPSPAINIIAGKNGSGKTNLLEAIYLNALGRSFRTSATRNIISDTESMCWVFGEHHKKVTNSDINHVDKIGLERRKGNHQKLSINGEHHTSLAQLAALAPVLALQPTETQLIDGSSSQRRKYLDWLVFHVEPSFLGMWRENQQILKQRNHLLRELSKKRNIVYSDYIELKSWDTPYIKTSQQISVARQEAGSALSRIINEYLKVIPAFNKTTSPLPTIKHPPKEATNQKQNTDSVHPLGINIAFHQGWSKDSDLNNVLVQNLSQDIKQGFTRSGPHRADLNIQKGTAPAKDFLSRGQKKLLAMLMRLAQAEELKRNNKPLPILLLDDLFAELDDENIKAFIQLVENIDTQVFLTCLNTETEVSTLFTKDTKMFHVEQGHISN